MANTHTHIKQSDCAICTRTNEHEGMTTKDGVYWFIDSAGSALIYKKKKKQWKWPCV